MNSYNDSDRYVHMRLALAPPGMEPEFTLIVVIFVHYYERLFLRDYPALVFHSREVLQI